MFLFVPQATATEPAGDPAEPQKAYRDVLEHVGKTKVGIPKDALAGR